ncbi:hypothetical protein [Streptomyces sp. NPDC096153]|uniref:hypothetical protein n=1 Tax=Streptomyces sp. NPDC096153 TaxID=3155548 RepID=UPI0033346D24
MGGEAEFTLTGTFTLKDAESIGPGCIATGGYNDIAPGTPVTVYGAAGDVVATGALGTATRNALGGCDFDVTVEGVPKGQKFYKVEVSHRGTLQMSAEEAERGEFAGSLG